MPSAKEVWIGFVHVRFRSDCPHVRKAKGGYAWALAWGGSRVDFRRQIRRAVTRWKMDVKGIKEIQPLSRYLRKTIHKEHIRLAQGVEKQRGVAFDTFFVYVGEKKLKSVPDSQGTR